MSFTFRQFYIPPVSNKEYKDSLCTITHECDALEAEGWQMQSQIALPGGREVLFTFKREEQAINQEDYEALRNLGGDINLPVVKRGRPRKPDTDGL